MSVHTRRNSFVLVAVALRESTFICLWFTEQDVLFFSYSAFLVRFYWLVLLLTTVVAAVFITVAFTTKDLPSLNEPVKVLSVHCIGFI